MTAEQEIARINQTHRDGLRVLREVYEEALEKVYEKNIPNYDPYNHIITFEWDCKQSPIGWCVYDRSFDPCLDGCLFCDQPSERK